jgi:hypothetical protein
VQSQSQVSGFRFQVSGFRFQVSGFRFQVSGFRFQVPVTADKTVGSTAAAELAVRRCMAPCTCVRVAAEKGPCRWSVVVLVCLRPAPLVGVAPPARVRVCPGSALCQQWKRWRWSAVLTRRERHRCAVWRSAAVWHAARPPPVTAAIGWPGRWQVVPAAVPPVSAGVHPSGIQIMCNAGQHHGLALACSRAKASGQACGSSQRSSIAH